ncbi:hypothetical protein Noda2021_11550 [Candidatus Dependentiae bacterium Noda2021]|nr:hypothetical protein Noda2021_11550 [Candidatus Dependentiae bacterium Noda2021]
MKQAIFLMVFFSSFIPVCGQWHISSLNINAPKNIVEIAAQSKNSVWALVQNKENVFSIYLWDGATWSIVSGIINGPVQRFDIIGFVPVILTAQEAESQRILALKNNAFITRHTFNTPLPVINIIEFHNTLLALENSKIHPIGQLPNALQYLTKLNHISDWTVDETERLWLVEKTLVGQGRQTTLFIKLKYWDELSQTLKQAYQQMGPRIFKFSSGRGKTIWSLQGDAPTQLYAFWWDSAANKWDIAGALKGLKSIDVTPDGTVYGLHHNNTIYEWREH